MLGTYQLVESLPRTVIVRKNLTSSDGPLSHLFASASQGLESHRQFLDLSMREGVIMGCHRPECSIRETR